MVMALFGPVYKLQRSEPFEDQVINHCRQTFPAEVINDAEDAEAPAAQ